MGEEKAHRGLVPLMGPGLRHSSLHPTVCTDISYSFASSDHYLKKAAFINNRQIIEMNVLAFDCMFSGGFVHLGVSAVMWSGTLTSHPSPSGRGRERLCVCLLVARLVGSIVAFLLCHHIDLCEGPVS